MTKAALYSFLAVTIVALYLLTHFTLNQSASEPAGLYRITTQPLARNALVLLKDPLKRLVGMPNDSIQVTAAGTYVNGKLVANSAVPKASPYPHYPYGTFKLEPDQYWVLGDNPLSYDSRYYGSIPRSLLASTVKPLWTKQ